MSDFQKNATRYPYNFLGQIKFENISNAKRWISALIYDKLLYVWWTDFVDETHLNQK